MKIYLMAETSEEGSVNDSKWITDEENLVIAKYRKLSEKNKSLVYDLLMMLEH